MAGVIRMSIDQREFLRKVSIGFLLPVLLLGVVILLGQQKPISTPEQPSDTQSQVQQPEGITITVLFDGEKRNMDLDTYLLGVVLGEMPAGFEADALRAQAVAARTYTLKKCTQGNVHGKNMICTDHPCCQAYTDPVDYVASGGSWASVERVRQCVEETTGQVLVYDGALIYATYFSCAGDSTEAAVAVWGQDYPYLQAVDSPGEEDALFYTEQKTFSAEAFQQALGIRLEGAVESWFGQPSYTAGGGIDTLPICGIPYRGTTLRTLLQLRSTAFAVSVKNGTIIIQTKGYGHRVGMSQYGANAMAQAGKSYEQILAHYYLGTEIVQYNDEQPTNNENFS